MVTSTSSVSSSALFPTSSSFLQLVLHPEVELLGVVLGDPPPCAGPGRLRARTLHLVHLRAQLPGSHRAHHSGRRRVPLPERPGAGPPERDGVELLGCRGVAEGHSRQDLHPYPGQGCRLRSDGVEEGVRNRPLDTIHTSVQLGNLRVKFSMSGPKTRQRNLTQRLHNFLFQYKLKTLQQTENDRKAFTKYKGFSSILAASVPRTAPAGCRWRSCRCRAPPWPSPSRPSRSSWRLW